MHRSSASSALLAGLLVAAVALPFLAPGYYVQFASKAILIAMLALSLNLVVGYGGMVSMCHAAFFGLAGYMLGFMTPEGAGAILWLALPATLVIVAVVAALIGALSLRTRGIYFIMVTLAFGEMLFTSSTTRRSAEVPTASTSTSSRSLRSAAGRSSTSRMPALSISSRSLRWSWPRCWSRRSSARHSALRLRRQRRTSAGLSRSASRSSASG